MRLVAARQNASPSHPAIKTCITSAVAHKPLAPRDAQGGSTTTNVWAIRLQLTKPVTWVPLIWGVACGAAASGKYNGDDAHAHWEEAAGSLKLRTSSLFLRPASSALDISLLSPPRLPPPSPSSRRAPRLPERASPSKQADQPSDPLTTYPNAECSRLWIVESIELGRGFQIISHGQ